MIFFAEKQKKTKKTPISAASIAGKVKTSLTAKVFVLGILMRVPDNMNKAENETEQQLPEPHLSK